MTRTAQPCRGRLQTPFAPAFAKTADAGLSFARKTQDYPSVYEFAGTAATAAGPVTLADDTPRRKFVKDLIRVGEYTNGGERIRITQEHLDEWVEAGAKFIAAGNDIPVPDGHTDEATANRGYAREFFREGDTLYAIIEMIGEDAIKTAARSKVSIKTDVNYTDGKGNKYPNLITHIALTNAPVVPDQRGFVPIAASIGGKQTRARLFRLALSTETNHMEALNKIAAMLGVDGIESLDEAALVEAIAKSIEAMKGMSKDADKKADEMEAALTALKASLNKPAPDPMLSKIVTENRTLKLSRLVDSGKITPAVQAKLGGMKFSIDEAGEAQFSALVDALSINNAVELGEKTKAQGVSLSRTVPPKDFDARKAGADLMGTIGVKAK